MIELSDIGIGEVDILFSTVFVKNIICHNAAKYWRGAK